MCWTGAIVDLSGVTKLSMSSLVWRIGSVLVHVCKLLFAWFCLRGFIGGDQIVLFNACSEKCHTSKLILRISWINYVLDRCHRGLIKRDQVAYFKACSEKCHTSKLILRISWINYVLDRCHRLLIKRAQIAHINACSEKCHTSKLILRISWINYVSDAPLVDIPSAKELVYSMLQVRNVQKGLVFKGIMSTVNVRLVNAPRRIHGEAPRRTWVLCEGSLSALWVLGECIANEHVASCLMKSI